MKSILYKIWEIVEIFFIAIIAVAAIKYFLIQPFIVNGSSMEPNFHNGDYLLVDELSYRIHKPSRGDVIVFRSPQNPSVYFIKRIIGLPGEKVVVDNDRVTIYNSHDKNGEILHEKYIPSNSDKGWIGNKSMELGKDKYFVMGDNRPNSFDSRYWGLLPEKNIIGVVRLRLWPLSMISFFEVPQYVTSNSG